MREAGEGIGYSFNSIVFGSMLASLPAPLYATHSSPCESTMMP